MSSSPFGGGLFVCIWLGGRIGRGGNWPIEAIAAGRARPTLEAGAIQAFFFERPLWLIPTCLVAEYLLFWFWARRRTPAAKRAMFVGLVVFPVLVLMQALVVTRREALTGVCRDMAEAARRADLDGIAKHISPAFEARSERSDAVMDRDRLLELVQQRLRTYRVEEPRLGSFEFEINDDQATVRFTATCRIVTPEQIFDYHPSRWELDFELAGGAWRVIDIRPRRTRFFPYQRLTDLPP